MSYAIAKRLGAGAILVHPSRRTYFKVSDWSDGTGQAWGWPTSHQGEVIGRYQKLPDGLADAGFTMGV
jgi:hypothetical protein